MKRLGFLLLGIAIVLLTIQSATASLTDGLVGYYSFDSDLTDDVGSNDFANVGTASVAGILGNSRMCVRSESDYANASGVNFGVNFTISVWVNMTSYPTGIEANSFSFLSMGERFGGDVGEAFQLQFTNETGQKTHFYSWDDSAGSYKGRSYSGGTTLNTWKHYVWTINGTGTTWTYTLYVNNVSATTDYSTGAYSGVDNWGGPLSICGFINDGTYTRFSNGAIDELAIYNRTLSAAEVASLYNNGAGYNPLTVQTQEPNWTSPTPASGSTNNTQVILNASCDGNNVYINFSSSNPSNVTVVSNSTTGTYTTNVTTNGNYYYTARCLNTTNGAYSIWTSLRTWTYDNIAPNIVLNPQNEFTTNNYSSLNQYDNTLNLSINFTDNIDLYAMEINVSKGGVTYYNLTNETLTGLNYTFTNNLNVTTWPVGRYTIYLAVSDSHTANSINDYQVTKKKSSLTFKTENENNIKIETREPSTVAATKKTDRYEFNMVFDDGLTRNRTFDVKTDKCPLTYRPNSGYRGHFVSACGLEGNWVDFEGLNQTPTIYKYDDYHYSVTFTNVPANVTFKSIGGLNVLNVTYSWYRGNYSVSTPYATKGDAFTMSINLTNETSINTMNETLLFNGTNRNLTTNSGNNWTQFLSSITIDTNGTYSYSWTTTVRQRVYADGCYCTGPLCTESDVGCPNYPAFESYIPPDYNFTVSGTQTINEWLIDDCSSFNSTRIRWTQYNENTPSQQLNGTFELYIEYWPVARTNYKTFNSTYSTNTYFDLCVSPANLTLYMDIYAQNTVPTGFTHRFYVQNGTFTAGVWTNYSIYNFNTTTGISALRITTRNNDDYTYYLNALAYLQRRYIGEGVWRTVQMDRSGDFGLIYFNIKEANTDYRLFYYDENNSLLLQTEPLKFSCTSSVCDLTQLLSESTTTTASSNVSATYNYNNSTKILTINWTGPLTTTSIVDLSVKKETGAGSTTVCSDTQTGSSGTLACNLTTYNGNFLASASTSSEQLLSEWVDTTNIKLHQYMSVEEQSIWSFAVYATVVMAGLFSPAGALIMSALGIGVLFFLGILNAITLTALIITAMMALFLAYKVKT